MPPRASRLIITLLSGAMLIAASSRAADDLSTARELLQTGKYAEAQEQFEKLTGDKPIEAAIGIARSLAAVGEHKKAIQTLRAAVEKDQNSARLNAEIALLALEIGDLPAAQQASQDALRRDPNQLAAQFVQAELSRLSGKLDQANERYQALVEHYNSNDVPDAESLGWIGLSAANFARWNRLTDQFSFLVNELYPDALKADPKFWQAHYESGLLFLEKYNQADASRALKAALKINPNAADVHAALAHLAIQGFELDQAKSSIASALDINPKLLSAHLARADIHFANIEPSLAVETLRGALELNPISEETLGRLAAGCVVVDGATPDQPSARAKEIIEKVEARNPRCGQFYLAMADTFDRLRRFPAAGHYYEVAADRMPQLTEPTGQLGMTLMRLGDETRAAKLLDESFKIDPFNVRVMNTLKVLEVLGDYETLETDHFIIKFDPQKDRILARYVARYLEQQYPALCQQLGYEPPGKSLFEIFNRAKNSSGHSWFSARMVGLPHIHTIGACAGKMVAMQSPTEEGAQKFNWARVLKHEFIHVINLQQTKFNIPHWYTEALATLNEGYPRPAAWDQLLAARVPAGKAFNLDTINLGFIRPHSSDDWSMAYCQAELYAEYMLQRFGQDALAKLLTAYADNLTTREAIPRAFAVEVIDFEKGYQEYLTQIVGKISANASPPELTIAQLEKKLEDDQDNLDLQAQLALANLNRRKFPDAGQLAKQILAKNPKHQLAAYVQARLQMIVGENESALKLLEESLDESAPQPNLLALLAGVRLKAEDYTEAARLYELGAKHAPGDEKWIKSLAQVYLKTKDDEKLAKVLEQLVAIDFEEFSTRKKLAQLNLVAKNYERAARFATEAMQIDVMDADVHQMLAEASMNLSKPDDAVFEFETLVLLDPRDVKLKLSLAKACLAANRGDDAKKALDEVLKLDSDNQEAKELLEKHSL